MTFICLEYQDKHLFAPLLKEQIPLTRTSKATLQIRMPTTDTKQQQQKLTGISPMKSTQVMTQIHNRNTPAKAMTVTTTQSHNYHQEAKYFNKYEIFIKVVAILSCIKQL